MVLREGIVRPEELRALGRHVAEELEPVVGRGASDDSLRARLAARTATRIPRAAARSRARRALGIAALVAAAAATVVVRAREPEPPPLSFSVGEPARAGQLLAWASAPTDRALPLDFSDGSRVVLAPDARGRVVGLSALGAEVVVEQGSAEVEVVHREGTDWRVRTGPFLVQVTGTRFRVRWDPAADALSVQLEDGEVVITGCALPEAGQRLGEGQQLDATCKQGRMAVSPIHAAAGGPPTASEQTPPPAPPRAVEAQPSAAALDPGPVVESAPAPAPEPVVEAQPPTWQQLARAGRYAEAWAHIQEVGAGTVMESGSPDELMLLGDAARLSGASAEASSAYQAVRRTSPSSAASARAAFHLGRMAARAGSPGVAARWYDAALAEDPSGPLAAAALGRTLEARLAAGDRAGSERAARRYLETYPSGPDAADARRVLGQDRGR